MLHRLPRIRPFSSWLTGEPMPTERFDIRARDGVRLSIHRVRPGRGHGEPVMLLHGLGANRHAFHFPGRSLAVWLADRGFDVYLPELRGSGTSQRPPLTWGIDDHLDEDLPAIISAIRGRSGTDRIHWVGHSLGGLMMLCYGILHPDAPIASATAIGTALDYRIGYSSFRELLKIKFIVERLPAFPYGTMVHLLAPLLGRRMSFWLDALTAWPPNIEPEVMRRIQSLCFHSIPMSMLRSLAPLFGKKGLHPRDRRLHYLEAANRFRFPLRLIGGTRDMQIGINSLNHTAHIVGGRAEVTLLGRDFGHEEDWGHWDLIVGRDAPTVVWPGIYAWLCEHAAHELRRTA